MSDFIIGDIHLSDNNIEQFIDILFPFLIDYKNNGHFNNVNRIVFLGDIFDSPIITNKTSKLFKDLLAIFGDIDIVIINGNHEKLSGSDCIYDILLLPTNVTVYKDIAFDGEFIYLPHINKTLDFPQHFDMISEYMKKQNLSEFIIYSHNDFNEIYKFKNSFFEIGDFFSNIKATVNLVNGHNHVSFNKENGNLHIYNIGCAINRNFNDSNIESNFLVTDDSKNITFDFICNKNTTNYLTYHILHESDIAKKIPEIKQRSNNSWCYVKFIIHDPSIVLEADVKSDLLENHNIKDISVEYDLESIIKLSEDSGNVESKSLADLCQSLNIELDEFDIGDDEDKNERMEVLLTLLNIMFECRETSNQDVDKVLKTIKKYF